MTLPLLAASCSGRPETPDYFKKVTSLPLCADELVRNVNADAPDRSPGFDRIDIVNVKMPLTCEANFFNALSERIGRDCAGLRRCSGHSPDGGFYSVETAPSGFRVTHST